MLLLTKFLREQIKQGKQLKMAAVQQRLRFKQRVKLAVWSVKSLLGLLLLVLKQAARWLRLVLKRLARWLRLVLKLAALPPRRRAVAR
ncbi:hypothetical protein GALL_541420 [mine drainage metagenome]|uniref:Uncharacterized protein n=1 Tax=mine drainage metagenome TaxID=410659 RepID=A0A1J5PGC6_9ZZZZ